MAVSLPSDASGRAVQALAPVYIDDFTVSGSSTRVAVGAATVVRLASSAAGYFLFGDSNVTAASTTSHFFPAGVEVFAVPVGATHVAFINDGSSSGVGTVSALV